jgi:hypothetical protein
MVLKFIVRLESEGWKEIDELGGLTRLGIKLGKVGVGGEIPD